MTVPELSEALAHDGHVFVEAAATRAWLEAHGTLSDWDLLRASWEGMPLDEYMADGGRYRRRRHATYEIRAEAIDRLAARPHYQKSEYNRLNGGVARHFEPIPDAIGAGESMHAILRAAHDCFGALAPEVRAWDVEVHQFRIEAAAGQSGLPTPEGVHRDGVDWVLVLLVRRDNIASGTTTIHRPDGSLLGTFTLTNVADAVLVDDARVFHGVTAVTPIDPSQDAYRDVLVVTFRRLA